MERTNRTGWIGLGLLLLLGLAIFSAVGAGMFGHPGMMGYGAHPFVGFGPWFWGFGLIGLVIRVAVWGLLIMAALTFFRRRSATGVYRQEQTSLEILKRRYAAGEISREQFEEMQRVLDPHVSPPQ